MKKVIIFLSLIIVIETLGLIFYICKYNSNMKEIEKNKEEIEEKIKEIEKLKNQNNGTKTYDNVLNKYCPKCKQITNKEENNQTISQDEETNEKVKNLTLGDYKIEIKEETWDDYTERTGTIENTKTNKKWDLLGMDNEGNIFAVNVNNSKLGILNIKEGYVIEPKYDDVSCYYHSDESFYVCDNSYTTIVVEDKLMSLKTGKIIVEADEINEVNNNFIAKKDNKKILYTSDGKKLLEKDYIGYISVKNENDKFDDIGYITFENNDMKAYSDDLKEMNLKIDKDKIYYVTDENRVWTSEDIIVNVDIKNNDYFKYNGNEYKGNQYMFIENPCYGPLTIYVIDNNKLVKLNNVTLSEESEIRSCF